MPRALFALDHSYPLPILSALAEYIPEAELVPLSEIDPRLPLLEDWEVLVALRRHPRPWAGRSEEHTLNSSHMSISYAVFCLKKKKNKKKSYKPEKKKKKKKKKNKKNS